MFYYIAVQPYLGGKIANVYRSVSMLIRHSGRKKPRAVL